MAIRNYSLLRGSKARLTIKQGAEESYKPVLYVEPATSAAAATDGDFEARLKAAVASLQAKYPGIGYEKSGAAWKITVPAKYDVGHEAHFAAVTDNFLNYLKTGAMPAWEIPNMLTKTATVMKAYEMSR